MFFCVSPTKAAAATKFSRPGRSLVVCCNASTLAKRGQQLGAALLTTAVITTAVPSFAEADLELGMQVFDGNCAACHAGGGNSVQADRTLSKEDVTEHLEGGLTIEAITAQVKNGKGAMPAWADRLDDEDIEAVVAYVFKNINEGW